jgi:hypothetical protein
MTARQPMLFFVFMSFQFTTASKEAERLES